MTSPLISPEQIETIVNAMPVQGRIMMRLLMLQYLDVPPEDVEYMAADRPDPRFQSGGKPLTPYISKETIQGITDRVAQYRAMTRHKRERRWLQIECLSKQIALTEAQIQLAKRLLTTRFGLDATELETLTQQARTALPKPAIRELERKWEKDEIAEEDYRKARLCTEYQSLQRKLLRERGRLDLARREFQTVSLSPLQDHEIALIWGIPIGSLAARKVKYLHQFLQEMQAKLKPAMPAGSQASHSPVDLWKETFVALSQRPVERSVDEYDGMEGSEAALMDKLTAFAFGSLPEEVEGRFWSSIIQEANPMSEYVKFKSLFALQRLHAILNEMDTSAEALEQDLIARISPRPKELPGLPEPEAKPAEFQLGEMGEHILRSFKGE
ncbi:MAG: hypothetical protein AB1411_14580 [Nitrospirota bacterium]